jgi:hypothetical protein
MIKALILAVFMFFLPIFYSYGTFDIESERALDPVRFENRVDAEKELDNPSVEAQITREELEGFYQPSKSFFPYIQQDDKDKSIADRK